MFYCKLCSSAKDLKDEISLGYDEQYKDYPTDPSDEKPFFLVKVPTLIDPEELEDIPSNSHSDILNTGMIVYISSHKYDTYFVILNHRNNKSSNATSIFRNFKIIEP